ncbi:uncharacterized protein AMSG_04596 [Thecamonas trahens ATCC 50062]|uniref:Uncharacterized protein n=1 Tax=Thecamonas trahens ATCC 50062 TaxID=461836 RepID=A0A0L0D9T6_THETB|nr:hypothetical protein AMSG_04596 [Thecamonas trahens ATCC 50062]KNC48851.1 hypothetical protein AMSG_04596 [Thecamonas trahens ATCC 50062]|eukprot:XP_013758271.1 hypothetical protein AMSG_04596 [Thecamonas trahens ATCC 50062]
MNALAQYEVELADVGLPLPGAPLGSAYAQWRHAVSQAGGGAATGAGEAEGRAGGGLSPQLLAMLASDPEVPPRASAVLTSFVVSRPKATKALTAAIEAYPNDGLLWFLRGVVRYNRARQHRVPSAKDKGLRLAVYDLSMAVALQADDDLSPAPYFRANALICLGDADAVSKARKDLIAYIRAASMDAIYLSRAYRLLAYTAVLTNRPLLARRYYALGKKLAPALAAMWDPMLGTPLPPYSVRVGEVAFWISHVAGKHEDEHTRDLGSELHPAHAFLKAPEPVIEDTPIDEPPPVPDFPDFLKTEEERVHGSRLASSDETSEAHAAEEACAAPSPRPAAPAAEASTGSLPPPPPPLAGAHPPPVESIDDLDDLDRLMGHGGGETSTDDIDFDASQLQHIANEKELAHDESSDDCAHEAQELIEATPMASRRQTSVTQLDISHLALDEPKAPTPTRIDALFMDSTDSDER